MNLTLFGLFSIIYGVQAQTIVFEGKEFELSKVKSSVVEFDGEKALRHDPKKSTEYYSEYGQ